MKYDNKCYTKAVNGMAYCLYDSDEERKFAEAFFKSQPGFMDIQFFEHDMRVSYCTSSETEDALRNYVLAWAEVQENNAEALKYKNDRLKVLITGVMFVTFGMFCK